MTIADDTIVRRHIVVDAPVDRAFSTFVDRFGDFKPKDHTLLQSPVATTRFEPEVGGRITDVGVDGTECAWARILAYEPPDRLVFSWDISPRWQITDDPERTSEVEVRFVAESPERTRVELEHRHLERHGEGWEGMHGAVGTDEGWPLWLAAFAELVAST